jgi:hypothetical protein
MVSDFNVKISLTTKELIVEYWSKQNT